MEACAYLYEVKSLLMLVASSLQTHRWFLPTMCIDWHLFTKHILGMKSEFFRKWICFIMYWSREALQPDFLFRSEMDSYRGSSAVRLKVQCNKVLRTSLHSALHFLLCSVYRTSDNIWKDIYQIHKSYTIRNFLFCYIQ
jgi:hypothetical protein